MFLAGADASPSGYRLGQATYVIRVAYATTFDASNVADWSGLPYHIARSLEDQSMSLDFVGPLSEKFELFFKGKQALYRYAFKRRHLR